ncbi:MAG: Holliday junction resolvase RuvX [Acidobacteriaceae bacterium]
MTNQKSDYTRLMDAARAAMDANPTEPGPAETPASNLVRRVIAFDVGDRRIGVAVSDPLGYTAQPLLTLHRTNLRADMKSIARLLRKHAVAEAVVGNPLHMSGDQSPQAAKAQQFAEELRAAFGLPVHLWDERLSTTEAHRHLDAGGHAAGRERRQIIDQVAAVLILQSFLDARANRTAPSALSNHY